MSTSVSLPPPEKKISSCVRPGVCDVRARPLWLVSALISDDLPTFERPANAISRPFIGGSDSSEDAAETKAQSDANMRRPTSSSAGVKSDIVRCSLKQHGRHRRAKQRRSYERLCPAMTKNRTQ